MCTGVYKRVVSLKKINTDLKVLLSIGSVKKEVFESVAASEESRKNLVTSSKYYLKTYNFDGIDLDWELPYAKDRVRNNRIFDFIIYFYSLPLCSNIFIDDLNHFFISI